MYMKYIITTFIHITIVNCLPTCPVECECYYKMLSLHLDCSGKTMQELPKDLPLEIEGLDLSNNIFTTIPSEIKLLTSLIYLNMSKNSINTIKSDPFSNSTYLEILDLSHNKISSLADIESTTLLVNAKNIKRLILSKNPIIKIGSLLKDEILYSESLETLEMSGCGISAIKEKSIVVGLPNLKTLILRRNPLKSIKGLISKSLLKLDMSQCQFSYFHHHSLTFLPALTHLDLSHNSKLDLSSRSSFLSSISLMHVDLSFCNMDRVSVSNLPNIETLNLRGNIIRKLTSGEFFNNSKLYNLDLSSNGIETIHPSALLGLLSLKYLNLSVNVISFIHADMFTNTPNISKLYLSNNNIKTLNSIKSVSLNELDLSLCVIQTIEPQAFKNMPYLVRLNLARNLINKIPNGLQSDSVQEIDLSYNYISNINNSTFESLPSLIILKLSGNRFTTTFKSSYFASNTKLLEIYLDDNIWRCDCFEEDMKDFYTYVTRYPAKILDVDSLMCHTPSNVSGLNWFKACSIIWYPIPVQSTSKATNFLIAIVTAFFICFLILYVVKRSLRMKMVVEQEERQRRAEEARERLRQMQMRAEQEALRNAPDPRDLISPPSYAEALLMPTLQGSFHSLSDIPSSQTKKNRRNRRRTRSSGDLLEEVPSNVDDRRKRRKSKNSEERRKRSQSISAVTSEQEENGQTVITVEFHESDI